MAARLNNTGVALMNQQVTEKALEKFKAAQAADASSPVPLLNQGIALLYLQKLSEAEEVLKKTAALDPQNPRARYSLGLVYLSGGNPEAALADMKKAAAIDPADPDTHYFLGTLYLQLKNYEHARQEFETALRLSPTHASAEFGLARALQRLNDNNAAREHLQRFQHLTQEKISTPLSAVYGEQGHYAMAQEMRLPIEPVSAMIPVSFVAQPLRGSTGSSACIAGITDAGHKDLVVLGNGDEAIRVYKNTRDGSFEELPSQKTGLSAKGQGVACAAGDFDNDGLPDLAVAFSDRVMLFRNLGNGRFADVTKAAGIQQLNHPTGVMFVDFDHDGDLDLYVTGSEHAVMWRNNGNGTFTEWTQQTGLAGQNNSVSAMLSDIDNDRAVDLVVTGAGSSPVIYENAREGPFKSVPLYADTSLAATQNISIFDFNKDGWMDVAVTHSGAPGISLWRNIEGKRFERVPLPLSGVMRAWGVTPIDIDNDGWIDLAVTVETAKGAELRVLRNRGAQGFEDVTDAVGLNKVRLTQPRQIIAADVDDDGATDLIVTQLDGPVVVLRNVGGNRNHSLRITLTGLADNKSALGTKVEVSAGGSWQKFEVAGGAGPTEIVAGLGKADRADVVRMLWPTGVPQDEIDVAVDKSATITELDRRGSSCPVLFTWDGQQYQFISDVIGAAVVGHWVSLTATNQADPDEWIKVDGSKLKERGGYFSVRFGEPMEEVNYIDQLRLVAIDHPDGTEVYPDERFLSESPFASGKPVVASSLRLPSGAWDDKGRNVLDLLARNDHKYVRDFTNLTYAGFANNHTLTIDLGDWTPHNPLRLLMTGFIEYFSASSMYAAWQAGLNPMPPYVEAQMPDGSWKRIIDDMGFPAGLPRTIVVDLTGKLPPGARHIRMTTNLQIYWDQVLVDNGPDASGQIRQTELALAMAHLAFRGYPEQVDGETPGDLMYHYNRISVTGPFLWERGTYTHYGNVTALLKEIDNHYVIFGSGEDIDAEFSAAPLPPLPAGWKRDYFFYANGFVKDMDFYETMPFTVADMPFHEMSTYPYPASEHYPDDVNSVRYRLEWNDRFESGDRLQRFEFHYVPTPSEPIFSKP
ncbi:MAG TPA: FG-GAP-like repeat-containing protein [Pseudacidobacterium sp.]|nr:FG-GAP-like repeat-containing protein [Pseudacidobacterium sp.]